MTTPFRPATNTTTPSRRTRSLRLAAVPVVLVAGLGLIGCGNDDTSTASTTTAASKGSESAKAGLTMSDAWVKTTTEAKSAAFGVLHNGGTTDLVVTGATTPLTSKVELHETVASADGSMKMQPKEGGFTVPAGGDLTLQPGGDHIMLMDLTAPITAGEDVSLTLQLKDGSTVKVKATAKDFTGANEKYEEGTGGEKNSGGMKNGETTTTVKMG
ncbi:MAG TPA: copper chaperone PCu(A)C [Microthrixaceae bacterium]|nr:copper chaperone PCu(A)C [Microthrixaceae bacterium]